MSQRPSGNKAAWTSRGSLALSVISFLADIVGLAVVGYQAIVLNNTSNMPILLLVICLGFFLGLGLGLVGIRGLEQTSTQQLFRIFIWAYLLLSCITYFSVIFALRSPYTFLLYVTYIALLITPMCAFMILRHITVDNESAPYAIAMLALSVAHFIVILYSYFVVRDTPGWGYVVGELLLWLGWSLFAAYLLYSSSDSDKGRGSFRSMIRNRLSVIV